MGCDIHIIAEYRHTTDPWLINIEPAFENLDYQNMRCHPNEVWYTENESRFLARPDRGRNYTRFYILAGVRDGEYKPISDPKGLPEDVSVKTAGCVVEDYFGDHSFSWLTLGEMEVYCEENPDAAPHIQDIVDGMRTIKSNEYCTEVRIVFGFDN